MQNFNNIHLSHSVISSLKKLLNKKIKTLSANNYYYKKCNEFIEKKLDVKKCIITNSGTSALEVSAHLINIKKGDEVIMPSYTFTSSANAFILRGAVPVFVDIREDTLNINENLIEKYISKKTKAIVAVHYAGVPCEMSKIMKIAKKYNLFVIEDAAQAIFSKYKNKYCGTIGDIGCFSFHETKNISCGEGGALLLNKRKFFKAANIICQKGTNRDSFNNNKKKFYSWVGLGSSVIPSEITCLILFRQLLNYRFINKARRSLWYNYKKKLFFLEKKNIKQPKFLSDNIIQNYHMYYLIFKNQKLRDLFILNLKKEKIMSAFHYIPLHNSIAGIKFSKFKENLFFTEKIAKTIVRLPMWIGMNQGKIINSIKKVLKDNSFN
jgi:dTDP-4-amino-4,6-dideoxygalactose transaminase